MRHKLANKKINKTAPHRKAMLANMATSLIQHEQIKTTLVKAKVLRPYIEKIITRAKNQSLSSRRYLYSLFGNDKKIVDKLFLILGDRYKNRQGGYVRIIKAGFRYGDNAKIAYIEFVDKNLESKGKIV